MAVSWALSSLVKSGLLKSASICARQADDKTQMATNPRNAGRRRATIFIPVLQSPTSGGLPGPQNKKETRAAQGAPPPRFPFYTRNYCAVLFSTFSAPFAVAFAALWVTFFVVFFTAWPVFFATLAVAFPVSLAASLVSVPAFLMSSFASCENAVSGVARSSPKHTLQTNVRISEFPPGIETYLVSVRL